MNVAGSLAAVAVGFAFGYGAQRGAFCMSSGLAGLMTGGWLAARRRGTSGLRAPGPGALVRRLVGGVGLGAGASIASGCTVGQGLTGLALLAPSSLVIMTSVFAGVALTAAVARRHPRATVAAPARG